MPLVLATATAMEMAAALEWAGVEPPEEGRFRPVVLAGRPCILLVTGIGPVNAALRLGTLLGTIQGTGQYVSGVLNLGLAGSLDLSLLPLGAVATAGLEIWPEYGLRGAAGVDCQALGFALASDGHGKVWDRVPLDPIGAARTLGLILDPSWPDVPSLTVAGVTATAAGARAFAGRYGALLENMEGFSLAYACRLARLPFLEVRTISNLVGSRDKGDWNINGALRSLAAAAATLFEKS